jgi:hypothetical protein
MFDQIEQIEGSLRRALAEYDPGHASAEELRRLLESFAAIERLGSVAKSVTAAELVSNHTLAGPDDRSDAHALAAGLRVPVGRAKGVIQLGERLARLPRLAERALSGAFSENQLALLTEAVEANPDAEEHLIQAAETGSLGELRDLCIRAKAEVTDPDQRRRQVHKRRYLKCFTDTDGMRHLRAGGNPEDLAFLEAAVEARARSTQRATRSSDAREGFAAHSFDALVAAFDKESWLENRWGNRSTARAKIIVRIDHAALMRGYPVGDEVSEIPGIGPIAPSAVVDMIESGDPFLAAVVTRGEDIASVVHLGRRPSAKQQTALEWLYPTCAVKGCTARTFIEIDHREDWARSHITVLGSLDALCSHHHLLKTRDNWSLVAGTGKRDFLPPDHPGHPRNSERQHDRVGSQQGAAPDGTSGSSCEPSADRQDGRTSSTDAGRKDERATGCSAHGPPERAA